jgi:plastocyanin
MNDDFRKRVFTPVVLPLGLTGGIALFAWSLSRIFLALPKTASTFAALIVAVYVLAIGAVVTRLREVTSRALGVGLVLGIVGVVGAGAVANAIGPREFHTPQLPGEEETAEAGEEGEDGEGGDGAEVPDDAVVFVAIDNEFTEAPSTVPAGTVTFALVNEGNAVHNVVIEDLGGLVVEAQPGTTEIGEVELEAGQTYSYICDIPGHAQTMNGEFTAEG